MRRIVPLICLSLAACGDPMTGDYPRLLPLEAVLSEPALPAHAAADPDAVNASLSAARTRLDDEARDARNTPSTAADLSDRAAALRARAAAIRCAEGTADCA